MQVRKLVNLNHNLQTIFRPATQLSSPMTSKARNTHSASALVRSVPIAADSYFDD